MKRLSFLLLVGATTLLSGCGGVSETLGLGRNPPDEFAVVDRPPLSVPPDYTLRPPRPGAPRPQEVKTTTRASDVLFGADAALAPKASADDSLSSAEKTLLEAAGSSKIHPNIRDTIDRETSQKIVGSRSIADDLLWWRDPSPATTVDAQAERERLLDVIEKEAPVNQGPTPVIERQKRGYLGL